MNETIFTVAEMLDDKKFWNANLRMVQGGEGMVVTENITGKMCLMFKPTGHYPIRLSGYMQLLHVRRMPLCVDTPAHTSVKD